MVAAVSGLADVDAITLSVADRARDALDPRIAARAIVLAAVTNTLAKAGLVAVLGVPALRGRLLAAAAAIVGVGLLSAAWL